MSDNKTLFLTALFLLIGLASSAQEDKFSSQPQKRGEYGWVIYGGIGASYYVSNRGTPTYLNPVVSKYSPIASVRLMWHPDHLLKVGLETGYMSFYSYTFKDSAGRSGKTKLDGVPLLIVWSMAVTKRLNLFAGTGAYFLTTNLDYQGSTESPKLSIGLMAAGSYIHPLSARVGLGTELKWMNAAETSHGVVALQLQLVWKFLRW